MFWLWPPLTPQNGKHQHTRALCFTARWSVPAWRRVDGSCLSDQSSRETSSRRTNLLRGNTMRCRISRCRMGLRKVCLLWPVVLLLLLIGAALTSLLPTTEVQKDLLDILEEIEGQHQMIPEEEGPAPLHLDDASVEEQKFSIIIQSFNRTDILLRLLNHYQAVPNLHQIIVVWNNVGEETPLQLWNSFGPHPVPVVFKEQTTNLMRNRLQPFPEISTNALLMLDDDTLVSVPDISFAFSVWKQFPDQIVGFVPRTHVSSPEGVHSYGSYELQDPEKGGGDKYSMVLIGAAFFHRRYMQIFQNQPEAVHQMVDETQNCDDIATNFIVALYLREQAGGFPKPSGVFVKPVDFRNLEKDAVSGFLGMWHRPAHFLQRSYCLNRLAQIYGFMPLSYSNLMISQYGFPSYANHKL